MQAHNKFEYLIRDVLKAQGYSEDVQNTSYDDLEQDDSLPIELRSFISSAGNVWQYLIDDGTYIPPKEPVIASSNLVVTPTNVEEITNMLSGLPIEHKGVAMIAVQMVINYINSKEK